MEIGSLDYASTDLSLRVYAQGQIGRVDTTSEDVGVSKKETVSKKQAVADSESADSSSSGETKLSSNADVRNYLITTSGNETVATDSNAETVDAGVPPEQTVSTADSASTSSNAISDNESSESNDGSSEELTEEEKAQVEELKKRDQEVRQHEQAHLAAAGSYANGGAQYDFQTGPDGKQYAIGGHVNIDTSPASNSQATIAKAKQIQRAALAPADPSPQDVKVAAKAAQMIYQAQQQLVAEKSKGNESDSVDSLGSASISSPLDQVISGVSVMESDPKRRFYIAA